MLRRFVILSHDHPAQHWDLLVEDGESLRAWRLLRRPGNDPDRIPAEPLPPHRLLYLDYEGPVSGNRGTVARVDAGECRMTPDPDGGFEFEFSGSILRGRFTIRAVSAVEWELQRVEHIGGV